MKATQEIFNMLQPGDYVIVKTLGQLIDTGVFTLDDRHLFDNVEQYLGKMYPIKEVITIHGKTYVTLKYDEEEYMFDVNMFSELYPLNRGIY